MPDDIVLDLPLPISTNAIWRSDRGGVHKSAKYKAWIKSAGALYLTQKRRIKPILGRFHATIILNEQMMRSNQDLDNIKCLMDIAKSFGLIVDDSIKYMRQFSVELGNDQTAPYGCKVILKSVE